MARTPKPWFWKARKIWCVTINGERHTLGPEEDAANRKFHEIMARPGETFEPPPEDSVVAILDDFLTWTEENRASKTLQRYKDFCQAFCNDHGKLPVSKLTTAHVTSWLKGLKWNSTTKRNAITALQRGFNWAVKNRGLEKNPIRGMEKPQAKTRTLIVSPDEFEKLLAKVEDEPFRDLLILSHDSGARPQEIKKLEARHIEIEKSRALIPTDEAKGGVPRAVYFPTDRSIAIVKRLMKKHPKGHLLRNNRGNSWTGFAVKCRLEDLETALGRRLTHYALRHSFVTRKLLAGLDSHVVASLAGHKDTNIIHKVYSHVADDHKFMLNAAKTEIKPKRKTK